MGEAPPSEAAMLDTDQPRKIDFHLARNLSNGFTNYSGGGKRKFQIETLNADNNSGLNRNSSSGSESRLIKSEASNRNGFDSELLSLRLTFKRIGAGLQNLGNTCFLNSVLQCLTYTEPLAAYLQSGKHQTSCQAAGFCALCAIQRHVSRALNSNGRILAPKDLVSNLRCISRNFRNARQEDAHEYMVNLLESMHRCCLPSGVPSESPSAYERSLVHKIFGGRLRSQVKCLQCSYCSNKFDPFLDLSLEILKADSVHTALNHFTAKEQLDGGAREYQCQQCNQKVRALKQLTIYKPPHVLAVHLKRFGSHFQGQKINKKVNFGLTIDLKPFVTGSYDGDLKYTLYGVLVHAGFSTHSGHYYCFVRTSTGIWYSLDDNQVVQVSERKVLEQKAYMLFYVRDQNKFVPKKPAAAEHKENMTNSKVGSKGSMQNEPIERKLNGFGSHTATKGDAANASALNESLLKIPVGASLDVNAKNSASVMHSSLTNLNASELNEGLVKIPADTNGLKADRPTSFDVKNSLSLKDSSVANINVGVKVAAPLKKASDINSIPHAATDRITTVTAENGDMKSDDASVDIGKKLEVSTKLEMLSQKKPAPKRSHLVVKKKHFKTPIMKMHLSTNILFRMTLGFRKRKKHRRKSCNLSKESMQEHLGLGPSTSDKYEMPSHGLTSRVPNKKRKGTKSGGKDVTETDVSEIKIDEPNERVHLQDHHVSVEKQQPIHSKSERADPVWSTDKRKEVNQNGRTTVFQEATVARWDGVEIPETAVTESEQLESVRIGYIGDEHDEDYDRGKQKKVRINKFVFDGSNPFQDVARRKAKRRPKTGSASRAKRYKV